LHHQIAEGKGKEAAVDNEIKKIKTYLNEDQIKGKQFQHDLENKGQKIQKIEEYLDANKEKEWVYRKELEEKIEKLMAVNQTQQHEIERLGKLTWETQKNAQASTSKPFPLHIDTRVARYKTYYQPTTPILTRSAMEDVVVCVPCIV